MLFRKAQKKTRRRAYKKTDKTMVIRMAIRGRNLRAECCSRKGLCLINLAFLVFLASAREPHP